MIAPNRIPAHLSRVSYQCSVNETYDDGEWEVVYRCTFTDEDGEPVVTRIGIEEVTHYEETTWDEYRGNDIPVEWQERFVARFWSAYYNDDEFKDWVWQACSDAVRDARNY